MCFKISTKKKGMSSLELSEEFGLRQKTVWEFKWKIQQAMASSRKNKLGGKVQVDEFLIGQYEEGKVGRSGDSKKKLVIVALEILEKKEGVGRAYAQVIDRASSKEFRPFFETYISKDAYVTTDIWKGYLPLKKDYPNLEQIPSDKGKGMQQLHIHIMNIQGWLRGIHHHCSRGRLQGYLDEYHFRLVIEDFRIFWSLNHEMWNRTVAEGDEIPMSYFWLLAFCDRLTALGLLVITFCSARRFAFYGGKFTRNLFPEHLQILWNNVYIVRFLSTPGSYWSGYQILIGQYKSTVSYPVVQA